MIKMSVVYLGLLYGGISFILGMNFVLSMLTFVPMMYGYHRHGRHVLVYSIVVFLLLIFIVSGISASFQNTNVLENTTLPVTPTSPTKNVSIFTYEILYFSSMLAGIFVLLTWGVNWPIRFFVASLIPRIGIIPLVKYMKEILPVLVKEMGLAGNLGTMNDEFIASMQNLISFFLWGTLLIVMLVNWLFALLLLRIRLKFNFSHFLVHVYRKLLKEFIPRIGAFLLLTGMAILFITGASFSESLSSLQYTLVNLMVFIIVIYIIRGISVGYFIISRYISIRPDWYFFIICGIILTLVLTIVGIALLFFLGLLQDWKNIAKIE